jgi:putative transposase
MSRKLRVQYPGAVYHVMNRGDRREPIYAEDQDRLLFLDTLAEGCEKTDWQVHAWCLMSNHFHLVSETPRGNLVHGMQWLLGVYTSRSSVYGGGHARRFLATASQPERAK